MCHTVVVRQLKERQVIIKIKDMKNKVTRFAIHIDDIERAKSFYDGVSGLALQSSPIPISIQNTFEPEGNVLIRF